MRRRPIALLTVTLIALSPFVVDGQWLRHPTPGIPRLPDGRANLSAPAPRTPDGKPDLSGLWRASVNYISDLTRGAKAGEVALLPAAEALVKRRRENFSRDDPSAKCVPGGVPRSTLVSAAYPLRIVTAAGRVVILYEAIQSWCEIHTDGRDLPPQMNPTWMGYSIGRWEGDAFVVTKAGFNDLGWLDNGGLPNTERLRVTERFRRLDFGHLEIEMTIDDPGVFRRPWTVTLPLTYQPDTELLEYICSENNRYFEIIPK
jgi:hypothetical protein